MLTSGAVSAEPRNDLLCTICVDVVTDLDNFITSDTTEAEIIAFLEQARNKYNYF